MKSFRALQGSGRVVVTTVATPTAGAEVVLETRSTDARMRPVEGLKIVAFDLPEGGVAASW